MKPVPQKKYLNYGVEMITVLKFYIINTLFPNNNNYSDTCVYIATYSTLAEANKMCDVYEKRGHRQVYWVEPKD
jgi:hypothetical protein